MRKKTLLAIMFAVAQHAALFTPAAAGENKTSNGRATDTTRTRENKTADNRLAMEVGPIRLRNTPLATLLNIVSNKTGFKFSFSDEELARKKILIFFRSASASEILEFLAKSKDIVFQRLGNSDNFAVSRNTAPFAGFPPLSRQDMEDPVFNRRISVKFKDVSLAVFLDNISEQAKVNFVVGGLAEYIRLSADMNKTTIIDVLQFLKTKGLSYSRIGDTSTFIVRAFAESSDKFVKAEKAFEDKDYEEAIRIYKDLAITQSDSEMVDYSLLRTAISYDWIAARDNNPLVMEQEKDALNRLIKSYPKSTRLGDAYLYLGQIYSGYGGARTEAIDCKKAIELYRLAVKNTYRDWVKAQAEARIAQCHERDGDKENAAAIYRDIVEKYPDTDTAKEVQARLLGQDALLDAGAMLEGQSEYKLAIEVYKRLLEKGSSAESARKAELRIGICQAALNETKKARTIVKVKPKN